MSNHQATACLSSSLDRPAKDTVFITMLPRWFHATVDQGYLMDISQLPPILNSLIAFITAQQNQKVATLKKPSCCYIPEMSPHAQAQNSGKDNSKQNYET